MFTETEIHQHVTHNHFKVSPLSKLHRYSEHRYNQEQDERVTQRRGNQEQRPSLHDAVYDMILYDM